MAKIIEETVSAKIEDGNYHITARNYNKHQFCVRYHSGSLDCCLSTKGMRELAKLLNETADQIDADPDFNPKKDNHEQDLPIT